ncbi:hypothetical protein ABG871_09605, partial [Bifidobacterium adolescentis]
MSILGGNTVPSRMDKKMRKEIKHLTALLGAISLVVPFGTQMATGAETNYPDMEVGVFWNSDSDRSDTVYMSYNGSDFQQISTAYKTDGKVVPEKLRTLDHGRPWSDDQFASTR